MLEDIFPRNHGIDKLVGCIAPEPAQVRQRSGIADYIDVDASARQTILSEVMPIPDYQTLMLPVLRRLADGADHTAGTVIDAMASEFQLTSEEREQLDGSKRIGGLMASRVHWAMTYLAQAGLTDRPRRGIWRITDEGRRLLETGPKRVDNVLLARYKGFQNFISKSAGAQRGVRREP
jgi:restriction endonuclease Mrr